MDLTDDGNNEQFAEEQNEIGNFIDNRKTNDVAQNQTKRRKRRHTKVLAVHGALKIEHDMTSSSWGYASL